MFIDFFGTSGYTSPNKWTTGSTPDSDRFSMGKLTYKNCWARCLSPGEIRKIRYTVCWWQVRRISTTCPPRKSLKNGEKSARSARRQNRQRTTHLKTLSSWILEWTHNISSTLVFIFMTIRISSPKTMLRLLATHHANSRLCWN